MTTNPDFRPVTDVAGLQGMNTAHRLFVIPAGAGFSCLGFDVAHDRTAQAAEILKRPDLMPPKRRGTVRAWRAYRAASSALADFYRRNPDLTHYDPGTPEAVKAALETARLQGLRVRIWCGDQATGEAWTEEHDVLGYIGRSTGPQKIPLLIPNGRSSGGGAILTNRILAIASRPGAFIYRHPKFSVGEWAVGPSDLPDYGATVTHNGELYARTKTEDQAQRLAAFMRGDRFAK